MSTPAWEPTTSTAALCSRSTVRRTRRPRRLPSRVELASRRDTVDVDGHILRRERRELVPRPRARLIDGALDRERPLLQWRAQRRPGRQDREATLVALTRRDPRRIDVASARPT